MDKKSKEPSEGALLPIPGRRISGDEGMTQTIQYGVKIRYDNVRAVYS